MLGTRSASFCSSSSPRRKSKKPGSWLLRKTPRCTKLLNLQHFQSGPPQHKTSSRLRQNVLYAGRSQPPSRFLPLTGHSILTHQLHRRLNSISVEPSFVLHRLFVLGHTCHWFPQIAAAVSCSAVYLPQQNGTERFSWASEAPGGTIQPWAPAKARWWWYYQQAGQYKDPSNPPPQLLLMGNLSHYHAWSLISPARTLFKQ